MQDKFYRGSEGVIISVNLYQKIREMYTVHQMSQRAIARELKISRNTVRKYCKGDNVPWERKEYSREPDVLTPDVIDFIRQCIEEDETERIKNNSIQLEGYITVW